MSVRVWEEIQALLRRCDHPLISCCRLHVRLARYTAIWPITARTSAARGLLRIGCMLWSGLAAHPDQDYAVPLRLSLRRGNRLCFQGFYELVRA